MVAPWLGQVSGPWLCSASSGNVSGFVSSGVSVQRVSPTAVGVCRFLPFSV